MRKKLFIDTNIMLDLLGERHPFYNSAAQLATLADLKKIELFVSPISFATVNYFLNKYENSKSAIEKLRKFKIISTVGLLNENSIEKSLVSDFEDFEDALQYQCALDVKSDIILTRNGKDFKKSKIPVMTVDEFLKSFYPKN